MLSRAAAFLIWALVAAVTVFWLLRLNAGAGAAPKAALATPPSLSSRAELSRVLGSTPVVAAPVAATPELNARFALSGVMAPKTAQGGAPASSGSGLALISVDNKPPRPYALGATVDAELVLLSVDLRTAMLGPRGGPALVTLRLPELPPAATGTLSSLSLDGQPLPVNAVAAPPPPPPASPPPPSRRITAQQAR